MTVALKINLVITYLLAAFTGVLMARSGFESPFDQTLDFLINIVIAYLMMRFSVLHAKSVAKPIPATSQWIILILWVFAVPMVMVNAKGWRGLAMVCGHFFTVFILMTTPSIYIICTK